MTDKTTKLSAVALVLLLMLSTLAGCSPQTQTKLQSATATQTFDKTITFQVVHGDGSTRDFEIGTNAGTLREALEQENLIAGTESEYGLYVLTVDGETADESKQEWWCFNDGKGEMLLTGVDSTQIIDGDAYQVVFTTGW